MKQTTNTKRMKFDKIIIIKFIIKMIQGPILTLMNYFPQKHKKSHKAFEQQLCDVPRYLF